ncbi:phage tail protein [Halomonas sp. HMF6819]|uniref:phage tail protein n=1 Tax=Halomonas sp. HMF6819 TaxID=3373085 RepID=UPI0037AB84BF
MLNGYRHNINELQALKKRFDPKTVEKAFSQALDRTTRKAATHISRDIRGTYTVSAADVKNRLKIQRARRDASRSLLYTGRRLPLDNFKPKERMVRTTATSRRGKRFKTRRRGATVRVRRDTGRQLVNGGWLAKGRVLRRADSADNRSQPRMQFGPSIPGMVAHESTIKSAQAMVREDLPRQFSDRMDYLLGRQE